MLGACRSHWLELLHPARGLYHRSGLASQPDANSIVMLTLPRRIYRIFNAIISRATGKIN
jgi:hypothetical protein